MIDAALDRRGVRGERQVLKCGSFSYIHFRWTPGGRIRDVEFDEAKDALNRDQHGISLARAADYELIIQFEDTRKSYGERRWRSFGMIDDELYSLTFTMRNNRLRAISLRRAGYRELRRYVAE